MKLKFYGLVSIVVAALSIAVIQADKSTVERHRVTVREDAYTELRHIQDSLTFNLYNNIQIVKSVPAVLAMNPNLSQKEFTLVAKTIVDGKNQIRNLALAPDLVIQYMYPVEGNEAAINLDYRTLPDQIESVLKAKELRELVLAGPIELVQGGQGIISRIPIFTHDTETTESFWGIGSAVIDANSLYQESGLFDTSLPLNIAIRGKDGLGKEGEVFFGDAGLFQPENIEATVHIPNGSWQIVAKPKGGWEALPDDIWQKRTVFVAVALLLFWSLYEFLRASMKASILNLKFRNLIKTAPIPYTLNNEKQQITFVNDAFINTFGYTLEDIPTRDDWFKKAYPDPAYREQVRLLWNSYAKQVQSSKGTVRPIEFRVVCKDNSTRIVLISISKNDELNTHEFPVILYDITERKQAEEKLLLSSRVFNDSHEGISIINANKEIIDINPAFSDITGYSREEVLGQKPEFLSSGKQNEEFYQEIWQTIDESGYWQGKIWNRKKDGEFYAELLNISALKNERGEITHYVGTFSDITSNIEQQEKLNLMAHYDTLTGLPNRTLFSDRFIQAIAHSKRANCQLAVCFLDLDNFKPVNDNYGHDAGDQLLIEVAKRIKDCIREEDTVSRQGGDEFAMLLNDIESPEQCEATLERTLRALAQPYVIDDVMHNITASIGVTLYPEDDEDIDTLIRHADNAMYQAKRAGKHRYHFFDSHQDKQLTQKQHKLDEIERALINNEFSLYFQPKVNMATGDVFGVEALIRWVHPEKGLIPPSEFLPLIDGTELELQIGDWVINQALAQMTSWLDQAIKLEVSVNVACHHLLSEDFFSNLEAALARNRAVNSTHLQLEILESSALSDLHVISRIIRTCQEELGVNIALDDFGTGYSSLAHLRSLTANTIKIDQSFVRDMLDDPSDYTIIDGVIGLAESFGREVIAEGVETTEHGLMLLLMGCKEAQGYGIARPMPVDDISSWLASYQPNREWLNCGKKARTAKDDKIKLFSLISEHWLIRFVSNVEAAPQEIEHWPIMGGKQSPCAQWIKRERRERFFTTESLDHLDNAYHNFQAIARSILLDYENEAVDDARARLAELQSAFDGMSNAAGLCE